MNEKRKQRNIKTRSLSPVYGTKCQSVKKEPGPKRKEELERMKKKQKGKKRKRNSL